MVVLMVLPVCSRLCMSTGGSAGNSCEKAATDPRLSRQKLALKPFWPGHLLFFLFLLPLPPGATGKPFPIPPPPPQLAPRTVSGSPSRAKLRQRRWHAELLGRGPGAAGTIKLCRRTVRAGRIRLPPRPPAQLWLSPRWRSMPESAEHAPLRRRSLPTPANPPALNGIWLKSSSSHHHTNDNSINLSASPYTVKRAACSGRQQKGSGRMGRAPRGRWAGVKRRPCRRGGTHIHLAAVVAEVAPKKRWEGQGKIGVPRRLMHGRPRDTPSGHRLPRGRGEGLAFGKVNWRALKCCWGLLSFSYKPDLKVHPSVSLARNSY